MTDTDALALNDEQKLALQELLADQQDIEAVKLCRDYLQCDLVQAKATVDALQATVDEPADLEAEMGLLSPLGIAVLIIILSGYYFIR